MVDFNTAIELIRRNGCFKPNKRDDSYYRTHKTQGNRPQQARISNHGTNTSSADRRWEKAADSRPLHRKGSLNREMDETINRIVSESIRRNLR